MNLVTTPTRINVGCGSSPTAGWLNYDNSFTVRISRHTRVVSLAARLHLLSDAQKTFARVAAQTPIAWANVTRRIPAPDDSVDMVYSSHMFEHLDTEAADAFLLEVLRVLLPGGILRLAVPDLAILAAEYASTGDCDTFIARTHLARSRPRTPAAKVRAVLVGERGHAWMYDAASLVRRLTKHGFTDAQVMPAGETTIPEPGRLDLREREEESLYVEAKKSM
ncbi:MAG: class I SAM-dependent methyltransferase [Acidimicrobiales bacterium]